MISLTESCIPDLEKFDKKFIRGMTVREIRGHNSIPLVNDYNVYCNLQFVGVLRCPVRQILL